jgi:dihydroorotate dehydrogenase
MRIGSYEMESPLMNAGGVVKSVEDVQMMSETGVGAVLAGSYTLEPRIGNSPNGEVVYHHDAQTGATYNALGMPNRGLEAIAKNLPEMIKIAHDNGKPFVLNLAPVSTDPVDEIIAMSAILAHAGVEGLDAIELNGSCPNVVSSDGGRHAILSHNPDLLGDVLNELSDIAANELPFGSLIVRVSPFLSREDALLLARQLHQSGVDAVSAFNTFPGGKPLNARGEPILQVPGGVGGQSGALTVQQAEFQTEWLVDARDEIGATFDIIGSNGVTDALSMKRRLDIGTSAVSSTTLFYEASRWGTAVDRVLTDFSDL